MELSKKTTILFPPDLHADLVQLAESRRTSLGELVRAAVRKQYGLSSRDEKRAAAERLTSLALPIDTLEDMIRQSVPSIDESLP